MSNDDMIKYFHKEAGEAAAAQRYPHALTLLSKAFLLDSAHPTTFQPLATVCQLTKRWKELEQFCQLRLTLRPNDTDALYHLAGAALAQERYTEAQAHLQHILTLDSDHLNALIDLGCVLKKFGEIDQALEAFRQAIALNPTHAVAQDNYLFTTLFSARYSREEIFCAHQQWGAAQHPARTVPGVLPDLADTIKIGYLSPDFRDHSVTAFFEPLLAAHDRTKFSLYCYHSHDVEDGTTRRLQEHADLWRNITHLDDEAAAALIRADGVHILVELAGHTAWNRLSLMNLRPAPIQATWLGYPHSSGLTTIDYRITDTIADPPESSDLLHTEQIIRITPPFLCFQSPQGAAPVSSLPAGESGFVTFCSFNNFAKVTSEVLAAWRTILERLPTARLLLKSEIFADPAAADMVAARLQIAPQRLVLIGKTPDRGAHLALYGHVDIALDTFPYNGTTTTCEAMYMGVPVVVLLGDHHAARVGGSLLASAGVGELCAGTVEEYVELAVALALDLSRLRQLRASLREKMRQSPLMDQGVFATKLETAYQQMLEHFSDGSVSSR